MDLTNLTYYIKSGINDARYNGAMTVSSIIIVIACLCVFGIYSVFSSNISYISSQISEDFTVTAYIEKGTPSDRAEAIKTEIENVDGVKSVKYVSESEALEKCKEMFGEESEFLNGLEGDKNPLRGSMVVTLNNISASTEISKSIENVIDVVWVKDDSDLAERIVNSTATIRMITMAMFVIFLGISVFIIANTIRITIIARKNDIYTMRYLGATNKFIIIPFVIEGIIIGLIGAIISYFVTVIFYNIIYGQIDVFLSGSIKIYGTLNIAISLIGQYIAAGVFIGGLSSVFPLVKYMRV